MIARRCLASAMALLIAVATATASQPVRVDLDSAYTRSGAEALSPEGLWQISGDGARFEIVPVAGRDGCFDLVMVESADLSMPAGTRFGTMRRLADRRKFDAELGVDIASGKPKRTRTFVFEFADGFASVSMTAYHRGKQVDVLRFLPYLFRLSVRSVDTRPRGIDGAERIAPKSYPTTVIL